MHYHTLDLSERWGTLQSSVLGSIVKPVQHLEFLNFRMHYTSSRGRTYKDEFDVLEVVPLGGRMLLVLVSLVLAHRMKVKPCKN